MGNNGEAEKVLLEEGPPAKRLVVKLRPYEGTRLLDLRYWYEDKKSGEFRPTSKGVSLTRKNFLAIKRVFDERSEEVLDWLSISYVPNDVAAYEARQEAKLEELKHSAPTMEVSVEANRRSSTFFEVRNEGGKADVVLNEAHPFVADYLELFDDDKTQQGKELLGRLLLCYDRAAGRLAGAPAAHTSIIFDQLEFDWGQMLKQAPQAPAER